MLHIYEPFIFQRIAEDRIFRVNPTMPFEYCVWAFQMEKPFFMVSQLQDGRVAITPNASFVPWFVLRAGHGPTDLLPKEFEYVTIKEGTYPLVLTAHPVQNFDEWLRKFERLVKPFAKQTLAEFIEEKHEFMPILEKRQKILKEYAEPVTI